MSSSPSITLITRITLRSRVQALRSALADAGACPQSLDYLATRLDDADVATMVISLMGDGVPGLPAAHIKWSGLMLSQFRTLIDDALADKFLWVLESHAHTPAHAPTTRIAAARAWIENSQTAAEGTRLQTLFVGKLHSFERRLADGSLVRQTAN